MKPEKKIQGADRSGRLEAIGAIAGRVAHDLGNLMTPLLAYPSLIRKDLPKGSRGEELLDVMNDIIRDVSRINQQLLTVTMRVRPRLEVFDLNDIVRRCEQVHRDTNEREDVILTVNCTDEPLGVEGCPEQISRVLQNLCHNAMEAMETGGNLDVRTQSLEHDATSQDFCELAPGHYACLSVSDSGPGISSELAASVFEPFFTTKDEQSRHGCGLGLSIVRDIVSDHAGSVALSSALGKGATFRIVLPLTNLAAAKAEKPLQAGTETVVVLDRHDLEADAVTEVLADIGYNVTRCRDLAELDRAERPDLLIVDFDSFGGGPALDEAPLLVLFSAEEEAQLNDDPHVADCERLEKPVSLETLAPAVRRALMSTSLRS